MPVYFFTVCPGPAGRRLFHKTQAFAGNGMGKTDQMGPEGKGTVVRGVTVFSFPEKWKAAGRKLHADLMSAAGVQADTHKAHPFSTPKRLIIQQRLLHALAG